VSRGWFTQKLRRGQHNADPWFRTTVAKALNVNPEYLSGEVDDPIPKPEAPCAIAMREAIRAARLAEDAASAREILHKAITASGDADKTSDSYADTQILKARLHAAIAVEEDRPRTRAEHWRQAVTILEEIKKPPDSEVASLLAAVAVECANDPPGAVSKTKRRQYLGSAQVILSVLLRPSGGDPDARAHLLARKSSVLRHQAALMADTGQSLRAEAVRCAALAKKCAADDPAVQLELALAKAACLNDYPRAFHENASEVERLMKDPAVKDSEQGLLSLSRFYRRLDRQIDACTAYLEVVERPTRTRRVLWNSYVYGEAVIRLQYKTDVPQDIRDKHTLRAIQILQAAIDAGYRHARIVVALAHLNSIRYGPEIGKPFLNALGDPKEGINWNKVWEVVESVEPGRTDDATLAFALGIIDGGVLNSLGTLFKDRLDDREQAEKLYRVAIKHTPRNREAIRNLADLLCDKGGDALDEAAELAAKVSSLAGPDFPWAAEVLTRVRNEIQKRNNAPSSKFLSS